MDQAKEEDLQIKFAVMQENLKTVRDDLAEIKGDLKIIQHNFEKLEKRYAPKAIVWPVYAMMAMWLLLIVGQTPKIQDVLKLLFGN